MLILSVCLRMLSAPALILARLSRSISTSVILPPCVLAFTSSTAFWPFSTLATISGNHVRFSAVNSLPDGAENVSSSGVQRPHRLYPYTRGHSGHDKNFIRQLATKAFIFDDLQGCWASIAWSSAAGMCFSVSRHGCVWTKLCWLREVSGESSVKERWSDASNPVRAKVVFILIPSWLPLSLECEHVV